MRRLAGGVDEVRVEGVHAAARGEAEAAGTRAAPRRQRPREVFDLYEADALALGEAQGRVEPGGGGERGAWPPHGAPGGRGAPGAALVGGGHEPAGLDEAGAG